MKLLNPEASTFQRFSAMFSQPRQSQAYLTPGMLHADAFPCLTLKAYNGRVMAVFLEVCLESQTQSLRRSNVLVDVELLNASVALKALCAWFDILERSPRFMNQADADSTFDFGMKFVKTYERLAILSVMRGSRKWKFIPKLHVYVHLLEDVKCTRANSRFFHCFRDEDFMGLCKRLAIRAHKGPLFEYRILTRYLLRLDSWQPGES